MRKKLFLLIFMFAAICAATSADASFSTRDDLRAAYRSVREARFSGSPFELLPDPSDLRSVGALSAEAQQSALDELNFIRAVAGLDPIALEPLYALRAQNAAYLLSVCDTIRHDPPQPDGMNADLYESGRIGALCSNLAMLAGTDDNALTDSVIYYARDDGDRNLDTLSHRRWMLNPTMSATGFGLSVSESGMSYAAMYAVDTENTEAEWSYVAWPSAGVFPVEMMRAGLAWSVTLNEEIFRVPSEGVTVHLSEINSGLSFSMECGRDSADGFCRADNGRYGSGICLIFRPNLNGRILSEYVQNQRWHVEIAGLETVGGEKADIAYECEMASLYPQDAANVEITPLKLRMRIGETAQIAASVIPEYADDRSVAWSCDNPAVAVVNESGHVTAASSGVCHVRAESFNGRFDECEITVE